MQLGAVAFVVGLFFVAPAVLGNRAHDEIGFDDALLESAKAPRNCAASLALEKKREMNQQISAFTSNPQVSLQVGYRRELETGGLEAQLNAQQNVSLGGYSGARKKAAQAEEQLLAAEVRFLEFDRRVQTGRAWLHLWGTMQVLHAAEHEVEVAQSLVERTTKGVSAGALTRAEQSEAQSYLAEAEVALLSLEGEAFEQGVELATSLGHAADFPLRPSGPLPKITLPEAKDALRLRLGNGPAAWPSVRPEAAAAKAEHARLEEVRSQHSGTMWFGAQAVREPLVPYSLVGVLGFQLPIFDRGQRERGSAWVTALRKKGDVAEAVVSARAQLLVALHDLEHTEQIVRKLRDDALPATELTLRFKERLLSLGEATVLDVLLHRRTVFALRGRLGRAQAEHVASRLLLSEFLRFTDEKHQDTKEMSRDRR